MVKVPVPPEECKLAGDLYVVEVPEDQQEFEFKGKFYRVQDSVKSGLNTGAGKFRNVEVQDLDKPKGALTPHYFKFEGYTKPLPSWQTDSTDAYDEPLYSTGAPIISKLALRGLPFTDALSKRTSIDKDLGTYYWKEDKKGRRKGMLTLVDEEGLIHHKLNHTSTVTSRLSSSDPNLQTLPRGSTSEVKKMFMSRFTKEYDSAQVGEVDYSQLEVVIQGVLTGDEQLCKDLNDRVDFHCKRLAYKVGKTYEEVVDLCKVQELPAWVDQRTTAKAFSFKRAYGAGVAAIVEADGIPKDEVEALVAAEEAMYPGIMAFDKHLEAKINANRIATKNNLFLDGVAFKQGEAHWDSPTGTRYKWREDITPTFMHKHGKYTGFSPTERKNYPVQGFGGEVVQTMLGLVFRYMLKNDRFNGEVLLVNTVHDCVWLDGYGPKFEGVVRAVQEILEDVPNTFNNAYKNLEVNVPFPCESEVGKDMFTMKTLH